MSKHEAIVVKIEEVLPHPDPETIKLGLVKIWGYQCVVNKEQWKAGDLAVYVEPDTNVPLNRPEFSFLQKLGALKEKERIKARRLRGTWSEGLLVPAPEGLKEGDDAWSLLDLERYEPSMNGGKNGSRKGPGSDYGTGGGWEAGPDRAKTPFSKYDLENWKKWQNVFDDSDDVIITEKIHGASAKYFWDEEQGRMFCGSRAGWRTKPEMKNFTKDDGTIVEYQEKGNFWWEALTQNPWIEEVCKANPNHIFFGEVFGCVQDMTYGAKKNEIFFRIFDIYNIEKRRWVDNDTMFLFIDSKYFVPKLYSGPYSKEKVLELTDGKSLIPGADHIREGVVIKGAWEEDHPRLGRRALKNVSNLYLERP